ncbi:MaoC/PaaZ C-terminal domain-containing protein [Streptomyces yanii]|uniref:MaoC/PaaZ C-terminal domain-containing protein n=1 Tax=Streptomyces yanii TaxID=78510 RepID=A0ABV5RGB4_9ACTN
MSSTRVPPTLADYPVRRNVPTRWDDHDTYDHTNNALYYAFVDTAIGGWLLEVAETDVRLLDAIGMVVESSCRFHREIRFPEVVTVGIRSAGPGNSSVPYEFALFVGDELAGEGRFVHVYADRHSRRPVAVPPTIAAAVRDRLGPATPQDEAVAAHAPRAFATVADLEAAKGKVIGVSAWHTIDQERVNQFAAATEDEQWIHVDPARAASGPYGSTIAHGFLTLSLVSAMLWEAYVVEDVKVTINYGTEKVRFPAPLRVGGRVRGTVELIGVEHTPRGSRIRTQIAVESDAGGKPVCVAETVVVVS